MYIYIYIYIYIFINIYIYIYILFIILSGEQHGKFDETWHNTIFTMLPKSGNLAIPSNWMHIAILPVSPTLIASQSIEQCAFTPGVRLEDALCTVEIAIQHCSEFRKPLWLLSMDMRKASDTVDHESLLHALLHQGINNEYIALIASLYKS